MVRSVCVSGHILVSCLAALLLPVCANALEAGVEEACVKVVVNSSHAVPPPDMNTQDGNADGLVDRAQFRLLDALLREDGAPHHAEVLAAYQANLARFAQDNTLGLRCNFMEFLYHFTCNDFGIYVATTFTLAEPVAYQTLAAEFLDNSGITLDPANYNLSLANLLPPNADLDGDGYTNAQEYAAVCGNMDAYVAAVKDASKNPATLPCCSNCVLQITGEPQDAWKYAGQALTLSVAVKDAEGTVHCRWYKGDSAVGGDAPELVFSSLQPADSGLYRCVVSDASETVTSRTAQVAVADHITITGQPRSVRRRLGDAHTFSVAVAGGFAPLHFEWVKDGSTVGGDSPQLTLAAIADADAGVYRCTITDLFEQVVSGPAELTVLQPGEGEYEGEDPVEGEVATEGEGEVQNEGEITVEGEGEVQNEGEVQSEGEIAAEGEGEVQNEGEAPDDGGLLNCVGGANGSGVPNLLLLGATSLSFLLLGWRAGAR